MHHFSTADYKSTGSIQGRTRQKRARKAFLMSCQLHGSSSFGPKLFAESQYDICNVCAKFGTYRRKFAASINCWIMFHGGAVEHGSLARLSSTYRV